MYIHLFDMNIPLNFIQQILMSVLRVLIIVILMLSALTQLVATTVPALSVTLGMEEAVVCMGLCTVIYTYHV